MFKAFFFGIFEKFKFFEKLKFSNFYEKKLFYKCWEKSP